MFFAACHRLLTVFIEYIRKNNDLFIRRYFRVLPTVPKLDDLLASTAHPHLYWSCAYVVLHILACTAHPRLYCTLSLILHMFIQEKVKEFSTSFIKILGPSFTESFHPFLLDLEWRWPPGLYFCFVFINYSKIADGAQVPTSFTVKEIEDCILFIMRCRRYHFTEANPQFHTKTQTTILLIYVSVSSKPDHPPVRPQGIRTFLLPQGSSFRPTFFAHGAGILK